MRCPPIPAQPGSLSVSGFLLMAFLQGAYDESSWCLRSPMSTRELQEIVGIQQERTPMAEIRVYITIIAYSLFCSLKSRGSRHRIFMECCGVGVVASFQTFSTLQEPEVCHTRFFAIPVLGMCRLGVRVCNAQTGRSVCRGLLKSEL